MVMEVRPDCETEWAAIAAIAARLGGWLVGTVRKWVFRPRSTGSAAGHDESGTGGDRAAAGRGERTPPRE